jgi:hypothetical protein
VCISGGVNSMAMAHWFDLSFNNDTSQKKLLFKIKFLYIDSLFLREDFSSYFFSDLFPALSDKSEEKKIFFLEERKKTQKFFEDLFKKYNFDYHIINLENILNLDYKDFNINNTYSTNYQDDYNNNNNISLVSEKNEELKTTNFKLIEKYLKIHDNIIKLGSFDIDFNKILIRNLIIYFSRLNKFNKIIFGNSGQSLVSKVFSSIIKGRGFTAKEETSYVDTRFFNGNPIILRPMKDFLDKEILLFNHINKVELLYNTIEIDYKRYNQKHSIPFKGNTDNLIDCFFDNLQNKMPSTITTVMGTADKLMERKVSQRKKNPSELNLNNNTDNNKIIDNYSNNYT